MGFKIWSHVGCVGNTIFEITLFMWVFKYFVPKVFFFVFIFNRVMPFYENRLLRNFPLFYSALCPILTHPCRWVCTCKHARARTKQTSIIAASMAAPASFIIRTQSISISWSQDHLHSLMVVSADFISTGKKISRSLWNFDWFVEGDSFFSTRRAPRRDC